MHEAPKELDIPWHVRELFLRVMDGDHQLVGTMYMIYKYKDHERFLKWLIKHNITGKALSTWIIQRWGPRIDEMIEFIVQYEKSANSTKV